MHNKANSDSYKMKRLLCNSERKVKGYCSVLYLPSESSMQLCRSWELTFPIFLGREKPWTYFSNPCTNTVCVCVCVCACMGYIYIWGTLCTYCARVCVHCFSYPTKTINLCQNKHIKFPISIMFQLFSCFLYILVHHLLAPAAPWTMVQHLPTFRSSLLASSAIIV